MGGGTDWVVAAPACSRTQAMGWTNATRRLMGGQTDRLPAELRAMGIVVDETIPGGQ
jgi:hypothetical protein